MTEWQLILNEIFPNGIPQFSIWADNNEIIKVLNKLGSFDNSNHLFYPDGGGMDLNGASKSYEKICIEISTGFNEIISPKKLTFHSFANLEWSYFRIELNELPQTKVYDYDLVFSEELCELEPLHYVSREYWDMDAYDDEPLPKGTRLIERRLKGSLVIVGKMSNYNAHSSTYDGRHNDYTDEEFRTYIETIQSKGWDA